MYKEIFNSKINSILDRIYTQAVLLDDVKEFCFTYQEKDKFINALHKNLEGFKERIYNKSRKATELTSKKYYRYAHVIQPYVLESEIKKLLYSPIFKSIAEDIPYSEQYKSEDVNEDEKNKIFNYFFNKYEFMIRNFIRKKRIYYIDKEDQESEGKITLLKCIQKYDPTNFTPFSSYFKQALHNKFVNLLKFHMADRRRIQTHTRCCGGVTSNSHLSNILDEWTNVVYELTNNDNSCEALVSSKILKYRFPAETQKKGGADRTINLLCLNNKGNEPRSPFETDEESVFKLYVDKNNN